MVPRKKSQIAKFASKARTILWGLEAGPASEHKIYKEWEDCIEVLMKRHEWSRHQAIVQASKDYKALKDIFTMYDVAEFDPVPGVECGPRDVHSTDKQKAEANVKCLEEDIPYKEQLRWAVTAAGEFKSDGKEPIECPSWGAYYLYDQAKENPREFLSKLGQSESKVDAEAERTAGVKKSSKRNVDEINEMLDELLNDEPEEEEEE